jgi:hypothetical protein
MSKIAPLPAVRAQLRTIVSHLRNNDRPSLAGSIEGLTPKMETAFRSGMLKIADLHGESILMGYPYPGARTLTGQIGWRDIGMKPEPSAEDKRTAVSAFEEWRRREVGLPSMEDAGEAVGLFNEIFPGISLLNANSPAQIYRTAATLELFMPTGVIDRGKIKTVNLGGEKQSGDNVVQYNRETGTVSLINDNQFSSWDRYLFTAALMRGFGLAVYETLDREKNMALSTLSYNFSKSDEYLYTSFLGMPAGRRGEAQRLLPGFLAENIMHYFILGESRFTSPLRATLYKFIRDQAGIPPLVV